jgi:16S rRNA (guanine(966)-N(2))-methyltransferase RsmD
LRVIAGEAHGRKLNAPRGLKTRPATARVRASIFSRLASRCELDGARVLDIFAGSGSLGLEALSRGAAQAVFVDSSRPAAAAISRNLGVLGLESRARIMTLDFHRALAELAADSEQFDLIFVDSPYTGDLSSEVLALVIQRELITAGGFAVVRQFHRTSPPQSVGLECVNVATLGDHRIALYRRRDAAVTSGKTPNGEQEQRK